ncbi:sigma intracellular receptor 2-like [Impatiens glandulifera]|uniref:sigma intracellular receptor 2-like n=1 Tax=Impatiens glandulifera TaxID=253017 RepID=UPI001FB16678|nr:sigma intracellular receptor 2-like [Impatiens glandulifera]
MGCGKKLVDAVSFAFCLTLAVVVPLIASQSALPEELFPKVLVDLKYLYGNEVGDYLVLEKPAFFVGLIWNEILLVWPLCVLNLFAIVGGKSWFRTTCLILGVTVFTSMLPIMADMHISGKGKEKMQMVYYPFMGFSVLAILRGLLACPGSACGPAVRIPAAKKKRT